MTKTIFDLVEKNKKEQIIVFDAFLDYEGDWQQCWENESYNSSKYDHCIKISEDNNFTYYICFNSDSSLKQTTIFKTQKIKQKE